jgi:hypothetical protein
MKKRRLSRAAVFLEDRAARAYPRVRRRATAPITPSPASNIA